MSVGGQTSSASVDQRLTDLAVDLRDWCYKVTNLNTEINGGGQGLQVLETLGYQGAPNPNNPNSMTDAQYALQLIAYLSNVQGVADGTVQQGGSGGTDAIKFDFNQALSTVWAGR
jgi:hypothetical protein